MQEQKRELTLFEHLEEIGRSHEKSGSLGDSDFEQFTDLVDDHLAFVCERLKINEMQAVLFSDLINLFDNASTSIKELADFIDCKPIELIKYFNEFELLEDKNLISISTKSKFGRAEGRILFEVDIETIKNLQNGIIPENDLGDNLTIDDFFVQIAKLCEHRVQKEVRYERTIKNMRTLLEGNAHLGLVKRLKSYSLSPENELILLRFCHYFVDLEADEMRFHELQALYNNVSDFLPVKQQLRTGKHPLLQKGLIDNVNNAGFAASEDFRLTDKAKEELLFEVENQLNSKSLKGVIRPEEITARKMFYPEKTLRQIVELTGLLRGENFAQVQNRLSEQGMRTGFACLFSGGPGTGKTETAYQIARETGRGIMRVDIADTKSKWFGESEQKIQNVFTRYRSAVKCSGLAPILLFNEADAVIGKRQNLSEERNGPGQTENAIQNIILQEIEDLNGILIATTNLTQNMDKAFERRFLYKIEFEKPLPKVRKSIWQNLVPGLPPEEAETLSARFDFSGGQIENVARRRTVAGVIYGSSPSLDTLIDYCREELSETDKMRRIGFLADGKTA